MSQDQIFEIFIVVKTFDQHPNYFWEDVKGEEVSIQKFINDDSPNWAYKFCATAKYGERLYKVIYKVFDFNKYESSNWKCYIRHKLFGDESHPSGASFSVDPDMYEISSSQIFILEEIKDSDNVESEKEIVEPVEHEGEEITKPVKHEEEEEEEEEENKKLKRRRVNLPAIR